MAIRQRFAPCLWFDDQAEAAVAFYTSVFPNSRTVLVQRYPNNGPEMHRDREGKVLTISFELDGEPFLALNGGPNFTFNEAVSLMVHCETQVEVDTYWEKLSEGGDPNAQQCGWLKDKFGVSWQITPVQLLGMFENPDSDKARRAMDAMMTMKKLDIAAMHRAFYGA